jgi:monoamine oxidase
VTIDACTDTGRPGVMCVVTEGPVARQLGQLDEAGRRTAILDTLVERFGQKARTPVDYIEQNWSVERYSGGGMLSHCAHRCADPVRPRSARTVRPHPLGRNRKLSCDVRLGGWGAIRSGERAASEVMEHEMATVA